VRLWTVIFVAIAAALISVRPAAPSSSASVAALQVALRSQGLYAGPVDGISGPLTKTAIVSLQRRKSIRPTGRVGLRTRHALGPFGEPLLGQRELGIGARGWDVSALEFRLLPFGLSRPSVDGRFTAITARALRKFQRANGLQPDGIAGVRTYHVLASAAAGSTAAARKSAVHIVRPGEGFFVIAARYRVSAISLARVNGLRLASVLVPGQRLRLPVGARARLPSPVGSRAADAATAGVHDVRAGEGFFVIAARFGVSPWDLARVNGLSLSSVLSPGQRLLLPAGARPQGALASATRDAVRAAIDRWSATYGVDPRLARALAWMESGFQPDVISNVGAIGVMQLLPMTWEWVDTLLIGAKTPRTYDGNVQAGVRYLRWQLDHFGGDTRLALAGYYQGARAVRERGLFDDTKQYVSVILQLYGNV
jgi:soluble lytic murein transglycosylase-like protein